MRNITHLLTEKFPEEMGNATDQLAEAVAACMDTGKKASVTIKIDMTRNGENSIVMVATTKASVPEKAFPKRLAFVTANGDIVADNPNQPDMFPRAVKDRSEEAPRQIEDRPEKGEPRSV